MPDSPAPESTRACGYAELHCLSNFSFGRGASQPEELVERAATLGYAALAITDECSLAGVVRAHRAAQAHPALRLIIGSQFRLVDGLGFVVLATDRASYARLVAFITKGRRQADKGRYRLDFDDLAESDLEGCLCLWLPDSEAGDGAAIDRARTESFGRQLAAQFPGRCWIATELLGDRDDAAWLANLQALGRRLGLPLVAAGDVHHVRRGSGY